MAADDSDSFDPGSNPAVGPQQFVSIEYGSWQVTPWLLRLTGRPTFRRKVWHYAPSVTDTYVDWEYTKWPG